MIRFILAGLAVLLAVLAFITGQSWLYAAAGGTGGVALGLVVHGLWLQQRPGGTSASQNADERNALGLSKVRPMTPSDDTESSEKSSSSNGTSAPSKEKPAPVSSEQGSGSSEPEPTSSDVEHASPSSEPSPKPEGDPRVVPFVRSLRHVLQAHTVALLAQEEMALDYRIAGLDSDSSSAQRSGMFSSPHPLLTARMSHADVTVRNLDDEPRLREALNYYAKEPPAGLQCVALAPIQHAQQSATYFLIVDGTANVPLQHKHTQRLLRQSAKMLARLLSYDPNGLGPTVASPETGDSEKDAAGTSSQADEQATSTSEDDDMVDMTTPSPDVERQGPRPRIEIIAEEMEVARATDIPLALALVHLNRADMIAEQGQDAVQQVEGMLHQALEEAAPHQRVERFGELTYGVFYQADLATVEAWTLDLHRGMSRAEGGLKGGVSVGVGMMRPRHETAADFRSEVTRALHEAYKSGTPVVID